MAAIDTKDIVELVQKLPDRAAPGYDKALSSFFFALGTLVGEAEKKENDAKKKAVIDPDMPWKDRN